jgi:hypothetical protein
MRTSCEEAEKNHVKTFAPNWTRLPDKFQKFRILDGNESAFDVGKIKPSEPFPYKFPVIPACGGNYL